MQEVDEIEVVFVRRLSNTMQSLLDTVNGTARTTEKWMNERCLEIEAVCGEWLRLAGNERWADTLFTASAKAKQLAQLFHKKRFLVGVPAEKWELITDRQLFDEVKFFQQDLEYLESHSNHSKMQAAITREIAEAELFGVHLDDEFGSKLKNEMQFKVEPARAADPVRAAPLDINLLLDDDPTSSHVKRSKKHKPGRRPNPEKRRHAIRANELFETLTWKECANVVNQEFNLTLKKGGYTPEQLRKLRDNYFPIESRAKKIRG